MQYHTANQEPDTNNISVDFSFVISRSCAPDPSTIFFDIHN